MALEEKTTQEISRIVPDQCRIALVPIANPTTAADLLHMAAALAHPDHGRIIALIVSLGDVEAGAKAVEELQTVLDQLEEEGLHIQLEKVVSTSVARGILDSARELGADLIILGINKNRVKGQISLGQVVENVLDTAPIDVLIYRAGDQLEFKRVVIPTNDTFQAQVASRIGIRLAKQFRTRIEAVYAQESRRSHFEGLAHIEEAIAGVPGREAVKRTVITAHDPVSGILVRTDADDLIIVGFSERSEFERWMFGDLARAMLNQAEGPVIIVSRSIGLETAATRFSKRLFGWFRPTLTRVEQDEIVRSSQVMASFNIDYATLIVVSATLATLGLMLNSAAVIIGAMLVAPLMQPLIGLSTGLVVGRVYMARRALWTLAVGFLIAWIVAFIVGIILPFQLPTAEMLARGNPTLLDAAVALASGVVGAYATARKDIPAALAGVAIAAALMPPVCTIGLGIALQVYDLAFGATVLFLTNIICIITAGVIVFGWLGMRFQKYEGIHPATQIAALMLLVVVAVPVGVGLVSLTWQANRETAIHLAIEKALAPADVVEMQTASGASNHFIVTVRSSRSLTLDDVIRVQDRVSTQVGQTISLELVVQQSVRLSVAPEDQPQPEITAEPVTP